MVTVLLFLHGTTPWHRALLQLNGTRPVLDDSPPTATTTCHHDH
jgi:hypothetical protein